MVGDPDELAELARAQAGDRAAFGDLVRRHQRRIYRTALHVLGNHRDADDVTQETFVRAYRALAGFDGRSSLFSWLYRIAVNTALNHRRSAQRTETLAAAGAAAAEHGGGRPEQLGAAPASPAEATELGQDVRRVLEAVSALSSPLRITLMLVAVEQLTYREVAELLEVPEGTVAWRVNEARRILRSQGLGVGESVTAKADRTRR
jgi:RNA polymerase sigma-70 factor, ECF subfamily